MALVLLWYKMVQNGTIWHNFACNAALAERETVDLYMLPMLRGADCCSPVQTFFLRFAGMQCALSFSPGRIVKSFHGTENISFWQTLFGSVPKLDGTVPAAGNDARSPRVLLQFYSSTIVGPASRSKWKRTASPSKSTSWASGCIGCLNCYPSASFRLYCEARRLVG